MDTEVERELREKIEVLIQEHRDLDAAIDALLTKASADLLQVQRLKKHKLKLKDEISALQDMIIPDIIA